jgi:hypothetical protein
MKKIFGSEWIVLLALVWNVAACKNGPEPVANEVSGKSGTTAEVLEKEMKDEFLWLEEVEGERALTWVEERNKESLGVSTYMVGNNENHKQYSFYQLELLNMTDHYIFFEQNYTHLHLQIFRINFYIYLQ